MDEFRQESLGFGKEGTVCLVVCTGFSVEDVSVAPSPRDVRIYLEGSSTEGGRSDLEGIPALEITHPSSQQQSRDAERAADPEVSPPLHPEQQQ